MWCIQHSICLTVIGQLTYDIVAPFKVRSYIWSFSAPKLLWLPLIFDEFHIPVPMLSILIKQVPSQSYTESKGFAASTSRGYCTYKTAITGRSSGIHSFEGVFDSFHPHIFIYP